MAIQKSTANKLITLLLFIIIALMGLALYFGNSPQHVFAFAVTPLQRLHSDVYWLSISDWIERVGTWSLLTYLFFGSLTLYTMIKAIVIVRYFDIDDNQYAKRLACLVTGSVLAALGPYRSTQAFNHTKDRDTINEMSNIRIRTLKLLSPSNTTATKIGLLISSDTHGLSSISDQSATYILSVMKHKSLLPNQNNKTIG
ncbi:hypothetical protein CTT30_22585 (plasmid) [Vibrio coralliilyticus]|nr:hypothetical protein CTT30_22585 [Vibrio coralliilyticus]